MKKLAILNLILWMLAFSLTHCSSATSPSEDRKLSNVFHTENDTLLKNMVLTITYVKRPWYGLRFMMVSRFKKSIPEYASIDGLVKKSYYMSDDGKTFGGIYIWYSKQDAINWFSPEWFKRIKEKYGEEGVVTYYSVKSVKNISSIQESSDGVWSVFSIVKDNKVIDRAANGLLRIAEIENQEGETWIVSVWKTKDNAKQYFRNDESAVFFDTPVHINN